MKVGLIEEAIHIYRRRAWDFWFVISGFAQSFVPMCCAVCRFPPYLVFGFWFLLTINAVLQIVYFKVFFLQEQLSYDFFTEEKVNQLVKK